MRSWFVTGPLHDPQVSNVGPDYVAAFLEAHARGVSPRTTNLRRAILHRVFRLCLRPGLLIPSNPVAATEPLRQEPGEPVLLDEEQYAQLRAACADHPMLALLVTLAWELGARSAVWLQLEWSDVDLERRLVTFRNDPSCGRQTKRRKSRTVPLPGEAVRAFREHAAQFRLLAPASPNIFKQLRPDRSTKPGDRLASIYMAFKRAARPLGLAKLRPHDLRLLGDAQARRGHPGATGHAIRRAC